MPDWSAYPSGWSTGVNSVPDTFIDAPESIGTPGDATATSVVIENSAFSLAKGIMAALGVAAGSGAGDTNNNAKIYADPMVTLGRRDDAPATSTGSWSAISMLKGILAQAGI